MGDETEIEPEATAVPTGASEADAPNQVADSTSDPVPVTPQENSEKSEEPEPPSSMASPVPASVSISTPLPVAAPEPPPNKFDIFKNNARRARELLSFANNAIQVKKRKRMERIMKMFDTRKKIQNDDVEKLLHVDDSTATVYLNILIKEGRIRREGSNKKTVYLKI